MSDDDAPPATVYEMQNGGTIRIDLLPNRSPSLLRIAIYKDDAPKAQPLAAIVLHKEQAQQISTFLMTKCYEMFSRDRAAIANDNASPH